MTQYVSNWYCENCVFNMFTMNEYSPVSRYASAAAVLVFSLALSLNVYKGRMDVVEAVATSIASVGMLNYIYTPQMVLLVTPMLLIAVPKHLLPVVAVADVFNALIMAFFFDRGTLVALLHAIGIPHAEPASPFNARSVIQLFANTRNMMHVLILLSHKLYEAESNAT